MVLDRRKTYEIAQALLSARNKRGGFDVLDDVAQTSASGDRRYGKPAYPEAIAERARAAELAERGRDSYRIPVQNSPANDNKLPVNWHCTTASHDCLSAAPTGALAALCRDAYRACVNSSVDAQKRGIPQMSGFPDGGMVILFSNGNSKYIPSPYPAWPANLR